MTTAISDPVVRAQYLVARSDNFRSWCGITTGTEGEKLAAALERVHVEGVPPDGLQTPFAVVEPGEFAASRVGMGGGCFGRRQSVLITFGATAAVACTLAETITEKLAFKASVRGVINDLLSASGTGTTLSFDSLRQRHPATRTADGSREQYWLWDFELSGDLEGSQNE